jgi:hypothetical protein
LSNVSFVAICNTVMINNGFANKANSNGSGGGAALANDTI